MEEELNEDVYDIEDEPEVPSHNAETSYAIGGEFDRSRTLIVADADLEGELENQKAAFEEAQQSIVEIAEAESARQEAEAARVAAEQGREQAETDRETAEEGRAQAEADRVSAEEGRATQFSEQMSVIATAIESAGAAAGTANDAATAADEAAFRANSAAAIIEGLGDLPFYSVAEFGDTASVKGTALTYPCAAFVVEDGKIYVITESWDDAIAVSGGGGGGSLGVEVLEVADNVTVRRNGNSAIIEIDGATIPSGTSGTYTLGTLPAGWRAASKAIPSANTTLPAQVSSIDIADDGAIVATLSSATTSAVSIECDAFYLCDAGPGDYFEQFGWPTYFVEEIGDEADCFSGQMLTFPCEAVVVTENPPRQLYVDPNGWEV